MHRIPHITEGKISSIDGINNFLRIDGTILSGQSGGAVVIEYVNSHSCKKSAVVGVACRSITGELGDAR